MHLIYLGGEAFSILKPKFEWKVDVSIGHVEMVEPPNKPLQDTTDEVLDRESNENNINPEPVELVNPVGEPNMELQDATPTEQELPDATRNLLVQLPDDMQLDIPDTPHPTQEGIKPCSINLQRCDIVPCCVSTAASIEVNVIVNNPGYDLRKNSNKGTNMATSTTRSKRDASRNISYVPMFKESSMDEEVPTTGSIETNTPKCAPSHYRLAAHKYMLARKRGLITGPRVRTKAVPIQKPIDDTNIDSDSDATIILRQQ